MPAVPKSLDAIATEKKSLEAQLKALQEQEQRLIEAKALKLIPCYDGKGVLIEKEGSQMALLLENAQELVERPARRFANTDAQLWFGQEIGQLLYEPGPLLRCFCKGDASLSNG